MRRQRKRTSAFSDNKKTTENDTMRIYTQKSTGSKKSSKTKKAKKKRHIFRKLFTALLMIFFVVAVVAAGVAAGMYAAISREMKDMDIKNLSLNYSSFIYYTDKLGNSHELEQLYDDGNRIWLEPNEIPQVIKDAVVAIEDERFYSHNGVDLKRTLGAFVNWTIEKLGGERATYGGSTITQQVIKNITHEKERSSMRKIKEMMRAVALEKEITKDEILTMYLNIVFFANNCYGVEAAANTYFDKDAYELDLHEAAMIAGITQRPSYYDPVKNPDNALEKRNVVLGKMNELGLVTQEEYEEAINSDLGLTKNKRKSQTKIYSYFVDQVINDIISDLQTQKGYSEEFARQQVYNGGLKIYTTMDNDIQEKMEEVFEKNSNFPTNSRAKKAQSAMIIIDYKTGEVKGIVGGKGEKTDSRGLNRATQSKRQPGSSFKPLSVYAPAIDTKKITASTITKDEKITIGEWSPKNAYSGYRGELSLRKAIEISSNTVAVKTLQDLGVSTSYSYIKDHFNMTSVESADKDLSPLGLGGLTYGVTLREMAAAYGSLANSGLYIKPYTYTKVIDNTGKLLLENSSEVKTAVSPETAYIITDLMQSVVKGSEGTGKLAALKNMPVSGKTGTSNNDNDKWFVGYTPYYVGVVWYGFDMPASIREAGVSTNVSAKIWGMVMKKVHEDLSSKDFPKPSGIEEKSVCSKTGKLASKGCYHSKTEYYISGTEPKKYCNNNHWSDKVEEEESVSEEIQENTGGSSAEPAMTPMPTPDPEIEEYERQWQEAYDRFN